MPPLVGALLEEILHLVVAEEPYVLHEPGRVRKRHKVAAEVRRVVPDVQRTVPPPALDRLLELAVRRREPLADRTVKVAFVRAEADNDVLGELGLRRHDRMLISQRLKLHAGEPHLRVGRQPVHKANERSGRRALLSVDALAFRAAAPVLAVGIGDSVEARPRIGRDAREYAVARPHVVLFLREAEPRVLRYELMKRVAAAKALAEAAEVASLLGRNVAERIEVEAQLGAKRRLDRIKPVGAAALEGGLLHAVEACRQADVAFRRKLEPARVEPRAALVLKEGIDAKEASARISAGYLQRAVHRPQAECVHAKRRIGLEAQCDMRLRQVLRELGPCELKTRIGGRGKPRRNGQRENRGHHRPFSARPHRHRRTPRHLRASGTSASAP